MKKFNIILILLALILTSCEKTGIKSETDFLLEGIWTFEEYNNDIQVFSRSTELIDDHCYVFRSDGTLTERKISGWCGTPPVTYANYAGTWETENDTLVRIEVGYWGGHTSYNIDLEYIDNQVLKFRNIYE